MRLLYHLLYPTNALANAAKELLYNILLFDILFPKLIKKASEINTRLARNTNNKVFKFSSNMFVSWKYLGNLAVQ